MNKTVILIATMMLASCKFETPEGKCIGFDDTPTDGVKYEFSTRNAVWTAIGIETVVAPVVWALECAKCPVEKRGK